MGVHKNGKNYYYNFQYKGKRFQASTRTSNHDQAFQIYLEKKNEITRHKLRYVYEPPLSVGCRATDWEKLHQILFINVTFTSH